MRLIKGTRSNSPAIISLKHFFFSLNGVIKCKSPSIPNVMFSFGLFLAINAGSEPQRNQEVSLLQTLMCYSGDEGTRPLVASTSLFLVYYPDVLVQNGQHEPK